MRRKLSIALVAGSLWTACPAAGQTLTTLASFNGANGVHPYSGLVADPGGNMYGTTWNGGANAAGTIYPFDAATHAINTLFSFDGSNRAQPYAGLLRDAGGNLFGTTRIGGTYGGGTVFQLSASTHMLTTLHSFNDLDGEFPYASLVADPNHNLFGATNSGGLGGWGTIYRIDAGTRTLDTLISFSFGDINGQRPVAEPIYLDDGNLYGTTAATLFSLSPSTHAFTVLASFGDSHGGPPSGVVADAAGNLYGTTTLGGPDNKGTIFEFVSATKQLITLATFDGSNGGEPMGGVIIGADGNLYGTTYVGGAYDFGTVFKFDRTEGTIATLASFNGGFETGPMAGLTADDNGNYFGTTSGGGEFGYGTVFEVSVPEPTALSVLAFVMMLASMRSRRGDLGRSQSVNLIG